MAAQDTTSRRNTGTFLYAVVPADVEPTGDAHGVGDPPRDVDAVRHGEVAALVSQVPLDEPLGRPADLRAYQHLLDATATVAPVLPVRFGAVLADTDAVTELLTTYHDAFAAALAEVAGRVQFTVRARYREEAMLTGVLESNAEARRLRDQIRGGDEQATRSERIRLGEIVSQVVAAQRDIDTGRMVEALQPLAERLVVLPASHELDAANIALLVADDRRDDLDDAVRDLAVQWSDRADVRLLGPHAPYDFVAPLAPVE
jgi:hypothetical protein